jgi:hypothetical protein
MCVYIYMYMYVCVCIYIYTYVWNVCVCVYIYIYIHIYQTLLTGFKIMYQESASYIHNIHSLSRTNDDMKTSLKWI